MKVVNKKLWVITITLLVVIECVFTYLSVKSYSNKDITELKEENKINKEMFAMYVENDDGNYEEYKDGESFTIAGYKLNISKSNCVDNKGNAVSDIITNSNNKVTVSSNKTVFCYLYFDKDKSVYAKVVSDYQNNNGASKLSSTSAETGNLYDVYYYTGDITNNNILYGGFCWKMVITTETGGVKLIYNGSPKEVFETEPIEENQYVVSTNTPEDKPFTFDSSTKEWVSGIAGVNSTTNTIEFTVTEAGNYVLNYTVDSEASYDKGNFYLNGTVLKTNISGIGQSGTIDLSGLTTSDVIKITYVKDSSGNKGTDTVRFSIGKSTGEKTLSCDNTGTDSQIGTSKFNSSYASIAHSGYMYNTIYNSNEKKFTYYTYVLNEEESMTSSSRKYYFGDNVEYTDGIYTLTNATTYTWADSFDDLVGYYTCKSTNSTTGTSCAEVYYVTATTSSYMYHYAITGGNSYDSYKIKLATSVTDNGDGTYTLVDPIEVAKKDWYTNYSTYKNYYFCSDLTSLTCSDMYYSYAASNTDLSYVYYNKNYKYGNSFKYENGTYTLVDTDISSIKQFWNWHTNYNTLSNNHYTCFNTSGICTSLYYINYINNYLAYYITLTGGKSVSDALNEMLHAEDVNKIDSTIKVYIDTWYEGNLLETKDKNGRLYSKYLENTIFCANREINDLGRWDPNGIVASDKHMYYNNDSLECANKIDRFTLKKDRGGTEGYGNNALDYPIGLISYKEASLATENGYLVSGSTYWLLSPSMFYSYHTANVNRVNSNGGLGSNYATGTLGVRPAVSLSNSVEITSGNGSVTNPYQVKLSE